MNNKAKVSIKNLVFENMVLERGLLVAPVVVMCYSLKNALALSFAFATITFITVSLSVFLPKAIPYTIRVIINVVIASLVFIPTAMLINYVNAGLVYKLGIFLPLLVTNSLIVQKSETRFRRAPSKKAMFKDLVFQVVGFAIVASLIGTLREVIGNGTLFGVSIGSLQTAPAVILPFAGFILIGCLSAAAKALQEHRNKRGGDGI